ncbi:MAG: 2-oxoacid:ferredoxin oxidoreductase subunit beta [Phycisphaerales bacterium JB063]
MPDTPLPTLKAKDFATDQDVRWCPGCGDYSILIAVQRVCAQIGATREDTVFVSGIGCSSRFPYYMDTYGFHSIHGRAPGFVTGIKIANPDLNVWMVTGDGDGLSIGGNHLMHILRRNVNVNALLFNNQIYGLTKGQYSPTSETGKKTKSSPMGSLDYPINPLSLALAAEASFVARASDKDRILVPVLERAAAHRGASFVEIYQNCNIFNDGTFSVLTEKDTRDGSRLVLEHGKPLVFGAEGELAVVRDGFDLKVVATASVDASEILVHDEGGSDAYHQLLSTLSQPTPIGVLRAVDGPVYDDLLHAQLQTEIAKRGPGDLQELLRGRDFWTIK